MLRSLFGLGPKTDLTHVIANGAQIIDVRTKAEYADGHVKGSLNIPLDALTQNLHKIRKDKPVITCCRSGMRSGQATQILKAQGFDAYNGGPWNSVAQLLAKR